MGALHLIFWSIGITFGLRIIEETGRWLSKSGTGHLKLWAAIFVFVCFQMTTTLRPIVGKSDRFFPGEKKFFVSHWIETMSASSSGKDKHAGP